MGVKTPSDMSETFGNLFNARDRNGLLDLYVDDGMLTIDGESSAYGKAAIGEMMAPMLDSPLKISTKCAFSHENGDTAIVRTDWILTEPYGSVAMTGSSAEVLRRDSDGL
jgi:ketosteroid isomerase-like protein